MLHSESLKQERKEERKSVKIEYPAAEMVLQLRTCITEDSLEVQNL